MHQVSCLVPYIAQSFDTYIRPSKTVRSHEIGIESQNIRCERANSVCVADLSDFSGLKRRVQGDQILACEETAFVLPVLFFDEKEKYKLFYSCESSFKRLLVEDCYKYISGNNIFTLGESNKLLWDGTHENKALFSTQ